MQRGISRWKLVGDELIRDIERGHVAPHARLPRAQDLAQRFGVNRHTVLRALAYLEDLGVVRFERGRGAHVVVNPLEYRIGARRWFEQNLLALNRSPARRVVSVVEMPAEAAVAKALGIAPGAPVARVTLVGEADGQPVNFNIHFFSLERLPGVGEEFRAFGAASTPGISFSAIFKAHGIADWSRRSVRIRSRPPTEQEVKELKMPPSDHVLETEVLSVDGDGRPLVFATTSFASSRVELTLDFSSDRTLEG